MTVENSHRWNGAFIALGLAICGWLIGNGVARMRSNDRYVTVKGVSEQSVRADLAIWPIRLQVAGNDLSAAQAQMETNVRNVMQFLAGQHVDTTQVGLQDFGVTDAFTDRFDSARPANRYVIKQTIMVRSNHPDVIRTASQHVSQLAASGVVLSSGEEYRSTGPQFVFTGLNQLKPRMIADATARAREAAEQFARDSHSSLGGIRTANQGVFEILPRDQGEGQNESGQIDKTVRVVSTVEYFLKN